MFIDVRLFAMLRERAGSDSVTVEVPDGATARDVVEAVALTHGLGDLIARMSVVMAVNREYADDDSVLAEGDELALIPPVSGGATAELGKSVAFLEGSLADDDGNVVATATATARVVKLGEDR